MAGESGADQDIVPLSCRFQHRRALLGLVMVTTSQAFFSRHLTSFLVFSQVEDTVSEFIRRFAVVIVTKRVHAQTIFDRETLGFTRQILLA